jgi:hypothetical protein
MASPSPSRSGGSEANCGPAKARTLASSTGARVYALDGTAYGCAGKRQFRLGPFAYPHYNGVVRPIVVAGRIAAYIRQTSGYDTSSADVHVRNLADGKRPFESSATREGCGEGGQSVGSLVAKPDGHVAWIGVWVFGSCRFVEVHRRRTVLDRGRMIKIHSLKLQGSLLTWKHGSRTRHATLR